MREKILFNEGWRFHRGEIELVTPREKGPMYIQAKTERARFGPACKQYHANGDDYSLDYEINPETWKLLNLPHDYVIEQAPEQCYNSALGYFKYENAWYRKQFSIDEEDKEKRICLFFEGIATHATIYLNGCPLKHNFCGYTSFEVDITDFIEFGENNVLAVYVNTQNHEGWWYEGGGIYRNVWLVKTDKVAVDLFGTYVKPKHLESDIWELDVEQTIRNDLYENENIQIETVILDEEKEILTLKSETEILAAAKKTIFMQGEVQAPHLWGLEDPHQYLAVTKVYRDGALCDCTETKFGFREYLADPEKGLFLNGKHVYIKGVCAHQDFGLTGKAVADNIQAHRIDVLKEMGANGYRCSHYPHSEATMDALDEKGFIVMAETRWFDSSDEGMEQLEMLIKRDRNRPSVLFWSIGNEESKFATEAGVRICKKMMARVKQLDDSRLVIAAVDIPSKSLVYGELDAVGINYNLDKFDSAHELYPKKPVFASECCATASTRGWYYEDNPDKGYYSAFDKDSNTWFRGRENTWKFYKERPWIMGSYQWISVEHRGECVWPRLSSQSGAIDLYFQKKDAYYLNQAHWIENRPILHLLPHWNWKGYEGEDIRVGAYTNCDEVELFLNGKSQGRHVIEKYGHGEWQVPYEAGELRAVGYQNGVVVADDKKVTTGTATKLCLKAENQVTRANGKDVILVSCYCEDENGMEVPTADPYVSFATNGLGNIVGTGSDICDHTPVTLTERKMRAGRISVAIQVGKTSGILKLYADASGLKSAAIKINLQ